MPARAGGRVLPGCRYGRAASARASPATASSSNAPSAATACARDAASVSSAPPNDNRGNENRSDEHTSELQSLMRTSYAVFCLKKKKQHSSEFRVHSLHLLVHTCPKH